MRNRVVCFDLDDTLYKEINFVESAFGEIASSAGHPEMKQSMLKWYLNGENAFMMLNKTLGIDRPIGEYLDIYRNHMPDISLSAEVEATLSELDRRGFILGIITDGRTVSQSNKISALGLDRWVKKEDIVISEAFGSEKSDVRNFTYFSDRYPNASFVYIGDNPAKDFVVPNSLHWSTIMLKDDGRNIHRQGDAPEGYGARKTISAMGELLDLI